jgi:non-homologous end joining protein Ku
MEAVRATSTRRCAKLAAVAEFAMHRRDRVAVLRPGPVRADISLVTEKEIALAKALVSALAEPFEPAKYRDKDRDRLEALIAAKVERRQTIVVAASPPAKPPLTSWKRYGRVLTRSRNQQSRPQDQNGKSRSGRERSNHDSNSMSSRQRILPS